MSNRLQALAAIHCSVILMGGAGLFAKFLSLSPAVIVCGRTFIAALALVIILPGLKIPIRVKERKDFLIFTVMGVLLAAHWITFFYSIQISTVAVGLLSYSTFPIFVTFMEPFFFKERFYLNDLLLACIVFLGLILVIPDFDLGNNMTKGVLWGAVSGLTFALVSLFNRKYVSHYSPLTLALYQDLVACCLLLPFAATALISITGNEFGLILLLGIVFTAGAHSMFIQGLTVIKAQLAGIICCLEPVYGIIFALLLLHEVPSGRELIGGVVIVGTIFVATRYSQNRVGEV